MERAELVIEPANVKALHIYCQYSMIPKIKSIPPYMIRKMWSSYYMEKILL